MQLISNKVVTEMLPDLEQFARDLVKEVVARGEGDLIELVTAPMPALVVGRMLGLDPTDAPRLLRLVKDFIYSGFPLTNETPSGRGYEGGFPEWTAWVDDLLQSRVDSPRDDGLTKIATARIGGREAYRAERRALFLTLVAGGVESTTNLLSSVLFHLASDSELLERVRADRSLVTAVVEESLRLEPPFTLLMRTANGQVQMRDKSIEPEERLVLSLVGANVDENAFADPQTFRLDRPQHPGHLSFGAGLHFCPGALLARAEATAIGNAFLDLVGAATILDGHGHGHDRADPALAGASTQIAGRMTLRVRVTPAGLSV